MSVSANRPHHPGQPDQAIGHEDRARRRQCEDADQHQITPRNTIVHQCWARFAFIVSRSGKLDQDPVPIGVTLGILCPF